VNSITFTASKAALHRADEVARSEGKTLGAAFTDWLIWYGFRNVSREEIEALFRSLDYVDAGRKFTRDEMNER
jgi:hypothetical protein